MEDYNNALIYYKRALKLDEKDPIWLNNAGKIKLNFSTNSTFLKINKILYRFYL